jgi:hypothetical protein
MSFWIIEKDFAGIFLSVIDALISQFKLETDLKHCVDYLPKHCVDSRVAEYSELTSRVLSGNCCRCSAGLFCILRSFAMNLLFHIC